MPHDRRRPAIRHGPSIGCKVYSNPDYVARFDRDGDIAQTGKQNAAYLLQVPVTRRMILIPLSTTTTTDITTPIAILAWEVLPAELGVCTPAEMAAAIAVVRAKADALGARLALGPSKAYWASGLYETEWWEVLVDGADIIFPQGKAIQKDFTAAVYAETYRAKFEIGRSRNPDLVCWCDLSPSPQDIPATAEEMFPYYQAVAPYVHGVWVTQVGDEEEIAITKAFFQMLGR